MFDTLPEEVLKNKSATVKQYFLWIQKIHQSLSTWKTKLDNNASSYDEIHNYTQKRQFIHSIAQSICAPDLVVSSEDLKDLQKAFLEKFENLNILLLKYVPGDCKSGW